MKARQYGDRVGRKEASEGFFTIDRITLGGKGIETLSPCLLLPTGSRGLPFDPVLKICLDMCVSFGENDVDSNGRIILVGRSNPSAALR